MSKVTLIEWTDATFSPWIGCTRVSAGCANCYITTTTPARVHGVELGKGKPRYYVKSFREQALALHRRGFREGRRYRVFPSLCDWLDAEVPAEQLAAFLDVVRVTTFLDWQLLSKRLELWRERLAAVCALRGAQDETGLMCWAWLEGNAPANVWIGTSIESPLVMHRYEQLLRIPAALRFLSCEPLLGNLVLPLRAQRNLHWIIVGGESGPDARGCAVQWIESLVRQCAVNQIPCYVKQLGAKPYSAPEHGGATGYELNLKHPKGGDPAEWPSDLRVRQFPAHCSKVGAAAANTLGHRVVTHAAAIRPAGKPSGAGKDGAS